MKELPGNEWQIEGDLVLKEGKVYVLKDGGLRTEVIQLHHDNANSRVWGKIENHKIGNQKLLVARSDKEGREIRREV